MVGSSPWSSFVRAESGGWWYLGEYEFFQVGVITPQQFVALPQAVSNLVHIQMTQFDDRTTQAQEAWAKKLFKAKKWKEYTEMRARIYLRKQKKNITPEAVQAALRKMGTLTTGDILEALKRGEEVSRYCTCFVTVLILTKT
jgi:hypothetical protein